jgi:ABC-type amino acid transport substrate-binding protein
MIALLLVTALCCQVVAARDVRVALHEIKPSLFTDEEGKPAGLFVDIIQDIAAKEDWNIIWVRGTLSESWNRLASGDVDLIMGVVDTPEREKLFDFSREPVLSSWTQVYARPGSGINTILDLDGKRVVLLKGDVNGIAFRDYARKFNINVTYIEKNSLEEVFTAIAAGDADAIVGFNMMGGQSVNRYGLSATPVMFNPASIGFAVQRGKNQDLLMAIDRSLAEGKVNPSSTYIQSTQKWFGMKASWTIPAYVWWGLAGAAGLAALFVIMSFVLRREVRKKTAELVQKNEELHGTYEQLAAAEEELRQNYQELTRNEQALGLARKKLNLLNTLAFKDVQRRIFTIKGFFELARSTECNRETQEFIDKGMESLRSVESSLHYTKKYQDLGIKKPRWQNVNYVFITAISHMDLFTISRTIELDDLEVYADPMLEEVFLTLMKNVISHGKGATEIRIRYRQNAGSITILFEDNGEGVPAGEKEAIFEWEHKGKGERSLFLAREILSITGISMTETGEQGRGARFEITVPDGGYRFTRT